MSTNDENKNSWYRKTISTYESQLLGYAYRIIFRKEPSEEIVQESFLKLWKQSFPGVEDHYPKAWLYTVTRNLAIDYLRREKRIDLEDTLEDILCTPCINDSLFDAQVVMQEIKKLSKSEQEVLLLKFSEELSYKEISKVTGLSVTNVGYKIHQGVQAIRSVVIDELSKHLED